MPSEMMTFNMAVSVLWAAYNSIPPLLLLHYALMRHKGLHRNVQVLGVLGSLLLLGVLICVWLLLPPTYDFGEVCNKALVFEFRLNMTITCDCYIDVCIYDNDVQNSISYNTVYDNIIQHSISYEMRSQSPSVLMN